ncbi:MAG: NADH-quinone oxidoreductase subunit C [Candidatus Bathyarchaeia archaeon]
MPTEDSITFSAVIEKLTREIEKAKSLVETAGGSQRERRVFVHVTSQVIKPVLHHLIDEMGFRHLSTITGLDLGSEIQVIYHLANEGFIVSLVVPVDPATPTLPTITDILPGAILYEREIHDLFGVRFEGHPKLSPLILPENWPSQIHPLRKNWRKEDRTT